MKQLDALNIKTCGELGQLSKESLKEKFGGKKGSKLKFVFFSP